MEGRPSSVGESRDSSAGAVAAREACVLGRSRPARRVALGSPTTFVAATEWLDCGVPVVSVMGELDLSTAPAFEETLLARSGDAAGAVIVDLTRCGLIDLRGLHVLLAARERFARSNRPLALVVGDPSLLRVFKVTRVDALFEIYPSLAAAALDYDDG